MNSYRLYVANLFFGFVPQTRFWRLKNFLLNWAGATVAKSARIVSSTSIQMSAELTIGKNTFVGHQVLIAGGGNVLIGNEVDIAPRVMLVTGSHEIDLDGSRIAGEGYSLPIVIKNGAWVGAAAVILGGVTIGEKSIVAAGSLVNKDVPDFSVVAGVPSKVVRLLK